MFLPYYLWILFKIALYFVKYFVSACVLLFKILKVTFKPKILFYFLVWLQLYQFYLRISVEEAILTLQVLGTPGWLAPTPTWLPTPSPPSLGRSSSRAALFPPTRTLGFYPVIEPNLFFY